jgi:hypothetical protein
MKAPRLRCGLDILCLQAAWTGLCELMTFMRAFSWQPGALQAPVSLVRTANHERLLSNTLSCANLTLWPGKSCCCACSLALLVRCMVLSHFSGRFSGSPARHFRGMLSLTAPPSLPTPCSRRHGGTVRCLAADAQLLASGSSDHSIRVWRRRAPSTAAAASGLAFDVAGERVVLTGHAGPISGLALAPSALIRSALLGFHCIL